MANLFFPQLSSGAMAQYPIRKRSRIRTVKNLLPDGSMFVAADPGASQIVWTLNYTSLPEIDMQALQNYFGACAGSLRGFTFLDPADNLLTFSADLTQTSWAVPAGITIASSVSDPFGGTGAVTLVNTTAAEQQITQTLAMPVSYQYCFSTYVLSTGVATCVLNRSSANANESNSYQVGPAWCRISSSGVLTDSGAGYTVGISLAPSQSLSIFGPQLEPQFEPSRYRATYSQSGLYPNAHWAISELSFTAQGPSLFSTSFSIETSVGN